VRLRGFADHEVASEALFYGIEIPGSSKEESGINEYASIETTQRGNQGAYGTVYLQGSIVAAGQRRSEPVEDPWKEANRRIQQAQKEGWKVESMESTKWGARWFLSRSIAEE